MFADLHALTKNATLLMTISAEDEQLRVTVTPTQASDKMKPHGLRPLSLLGTPEELDSDFGAALIAWQGPKRSLVEQAQEAAGDDDTDKAGKAKRAPAPASMPAKERGKPGPKKKDAAPAAGGAPAQQDLVGGGAGEAGAGKPTQDDLDDKGDGAAEFQLQPPPVETPGVAEVVIESPSAAPAPVVDTKTIDLF